MRTLCKFPLSPAQVGPVLRAARGAQKSPACIVHALWVCRRCLVIPMRAHAIRTSRDVRHQSSKKKEPKKDIRYDFKNHAFLILENLKKIVPISSLYKTCFFQFLARRTSLI